MFRLLLTNKTTSKDNKLSRVLWTDFKLISLVDTTASDIACAAVTRVGMGTEHVVRDGHSRCYRRDNRELKHARF